MSSAVTSPPSASPNQYTYTRGSTAATRSLVDSNPASTHQSGTATPSDPTSPYGTLHRRKTNNYESALADRLTASIGPEQSDSSSNKPVISSGLAYRGDSQQQQQQQTQTQSSPTGPVTSDAGPEDRPLLGVLGRQQSFKQTDQKRAQMERMLSSEAVSKGGYSSNHPTSAAAT